MIEWRIARLGTACAGCEREFEDGGEVVSSLAFDEEGTPERADWCRPCFQPSDDVVFWVTKWQAPSEKKRRIDFDALLRLFQGWLARRPEGHDSLLYLMALLLIRKRFYKLLDLVSEGDEEFLRLRRPGTNQETLLVPAPLLRKSELAELRGRLEQLLDGEFANGEVELDGDESVTQSAADAS